MSREEEVPFREEKSSNQRYSIKIDVLKNFAKFIIKHLFQSLFFNKAAGLRPAIFLKRNSGKGVFLWFCEIFKNTFFTEHLWTTALKRKESFFIIQDRSSLNCNIRSTPLCLLERLLALLFVGTKITARLRHGLGDLDVSKFKFKESHWLHVSATKLFWYYSG